MNHSRSLLGKSSDSPTPGLDGRRAFSLVEILVVVAIIGILAALLFPVATKFLERSRQAKCASNLRQLGIASMLYQNDNDGLIVQNWVGNITWSERLLPYLGMKTSDFGPSGTRPVGVFACPTSKLLTNGGSKSDYGKNSLINQDETGSLRANAPLHPAQVILLTDSILNNSCLRDIADYFPNWGIDGRHNNKLKPLANFLYLDGHVEALDPSAVPKVYNKLPWSVTD